MAQTTRSKTLERRNGKRKKVMATCRKRSQVVR
jgi:hypothetical protein